MMFLLNDRWNFLLKNILPQLLPNCIRDLDILSCSFCLFNSKQKPTSYPLICRQSVGLFFNKHAPFILGVIKQGWTAALPKIQSRIRTFPAPLTLLGANLPRHTQTLTELTWTQFEVLTVKQPLKDLRIGQAILISPQKYPRYAH